MVSQRVNDIAAAAYGGWLKPTATIADMRSGFDTMCPEPPADSDVTEASVGGVPGRWVSVPESGSTVVLHFHAGGYLIGSSRSHRDLAARIARATEAAVFLPDYRLGPEHPCPAALDDALAAYRGLVHDECIDPATLLVAGDSAGGGLALALMVMLRDTKDPLPALGYLCSPWADLSLSGDSMSARESADPLVSRELLQQMADGYLGEGGVDSHDPRASALFADLSELPQLLVQAGTSEVLEDDAVRVVGKIHASGGSAELQLDYEMVHVFQMFADKIPEGQAAIERIGRFVRDRIGSHTMV